MKAERLVHMANQIADFFSSYPQEQAVAGVADHLHKFWDPRMRKQIIEYVGTDGAGLRDIALAAIKQLAAEKKPK
ncbi:MAG TPA: formate dehydrogenase subunit delta [Dongiaceae bacterium]|jgi:formate dehydrogenase subunit delta